MHVSRDTLICITFQFYGKHICFVWIPLALNDLCPCICICGCGIFLHPSASVVTLLTLDLGSRGDYQLSDFSIQSNDCLIDFSPNCLLRDLPENERFIIASQVISEYCKTGSFCDTNISQLAIFRVRKHFLFYNMFKHFVACNFAT